MSLKTYNTEQEILDDIGAARKKIAALEAEAAELDASAEKCFKDSLDPKNNEADANWLKEQGHAHRDKANHLRVTVTNLLENRLPMLGSTLAAFRTEPMFFLNGDKTVALQK
jgi:hypothetical protein